MQLDSFLYAHTHLMLFFFYPTVFNQLRTRKEKIYIEFYLNGGMVLHKLQMVFYYAEGYSKTRTHLTSGLLGGNLISVVLKCGNAISA